MKSTIALSIIALALIIIGVAIAPAYTGIALAGQGRVETYITHTVIDVSHLYSPVWNTWPHVGGSYGWWDDDSRSRSGVTIIYDSQIHEQNMREWRAENQTIRRGGYGIPPVPVTGELIIGR